jgi:hypothetical protein
MGTGWGLMLSGQHQIIFKLEPWPGDEPVPLAIVERPIDSYEMAAKLIHVTDILMLVLEINLNRNLLFDMIEEVLIFR